MGKLPVRPVLWVVVLIVVSGMIVGYRYVIAGYEAQAASSTIDEHVVREEPPKPAKPLQARVTMPDRKGIPPENVGSGWPAILGSAGDCTSLERGLDWSWSEEGPPLRWRVDCGTGYSAPVVLDDQLVLFHRVEENEVIDCFAAETGRPRWSFSAPATFKCKVNYSSGPYSTPYLEADRLYAIGALGQLYCIDLSDGSLRWQRNLHDDYKVVIDYWPATASPIVESGLVIVNVGGRKGAGIVAFDRESGETIWTATDDPRMVRRLWLSMT